MFSIPPCPDPPLTCPRICTHLHLSSTGSQWASGADCGTNTSQLRNTQTTNHLPVSTPPAACKDPEEPPKSARIKPGPLSLHGSHTGIALRARPLFPTPGSKHVISAWIPGGARYIGAQRSGGGTGTGPNRNSELKSCSTGHGTCQGPEERNVNFDSDRACAPAGLTDATNVLRVDLTADSAAIYRKFHSAGPASAMVLPLSNSSW